MILINNVSKQYHGQVVLKEISLEIQKGEIFGVIGKSGAGKSTLLRTINNLCQPDSGSVTVGDENITQLSEQKLRKLRQQIGMIFQNFNLLEQKNVRENISLPLKISVAKASEIEARTNELIHLTGLDGKENSYPAMLSGGQKQRVAIARALGPNPKILLCDEATSALDADTTASILDLLKDLNSKLGVTIVVITHETEVIKRICERVALLWNGHLQEVQKTGKFFASPVSDKGKEFVGQIAKLSETLSIRKQPGDSAAMNCWLAYEFSPDKLGSQFIQFFSTLSKNDITVKIVSSHIETIDGFSFGTVIFGLKNVRQNTKKWFDDFLRPFEPEFVGYVD